MQEVASEPQPYQGIVVVSSLFSPPSLRITPGDVVDVNGPYQDYLSTNRDDANTTDVIPEFYKPTLSRRFDAVGTTPAPAEIAVSELTTYDTGRKWMSMLVTVQNVVLFQGIGPVANAMTVAPTNGRLRVPLRVEGSSLSTWPGVSNELCDVLAATGPLPPSQPIASITGVVTFVFGQFAIAPRSGDDIVIR